MIKSNFETVTPDSVNLLYLTPEKIQRLVSAFCDLLKKHLKDPNELRGMSVVLYRADDGWSLEPVVGRFNRRDYVVVVELPEDIYSKPLDEAMIDLAIVVAIKIANSSRTINSNLNRDPERMSETNKKAAQKRWSDSKTGEFAINKTLGA